MDFQTLETWRTNFRLIDRCFSVCQHKIMSILLFCRGGEPNLVVEDSQWYKIFTTRVTWVQWTSPCNNQPQVCLTRLMIDNAYDRLKDPMVFFFKCKLAWKTSIDCLLICLCLYHHQAILHTFCTTIHSLSVYAVLHVQSCLGLCHKRENSVTSST